MSAIVEFLTGIGDAILAFVTFITDIVADLIWFVELLVELIPAMPAFWTWLPGGLAYILGLCISVVVILRILGRGD